MVRRAPGDSAHYSPNYCVGYCIPYLPSISSSHHLSTSSPRHFIISRYHHLTTVRLRIDENFNINSTNNLEQKTRAQGGQSSSRYRGRSFDKGRHGRRGDYRGKQQKCQMAIFFKSNEHHLILPLLINTHYYFNICL